MKLATTNLKRLLELAKFNRPPKRTRADKYIDKIRRQDIIDGHHVPMIYKGSPEEQIWKSDKDPYKISGSAISFLLYAARLQDDKGNVYGLYYKEAARAIGCHNDYFYRVSADGLPATE